MLFDEFQVAIYNDDRERVDLLIVKLALATTRPAAHEFVDLGEYVRGQSFSPNPATLPPGQMVVWHNIDQITHRVVLNDRSVDTGDLAPGASSQPMAIAVAGAQYHCSIHPVMVGSVNQDIANPPAPDPCQGSYCC